jgi:hypothetical protein
VNKSYRYNEIKRYTGVNTADIGRLIKEGLIVVDRFGTGNHRAYSREDMELCKVLSLLRSEGAKSGAGYDNRADILTAAHRALNDPQRSGDFLQIWPDEDFGWVAIVTDKLHLGSFSKTMRIAELSPPVLSLGL